MLCRNALIRCIGDVLHHQHQDRVGLEADSAQEDLEEAVNGKQTEGSTDAAALISSGDACGYCRIELCDEDCCFECTHTETRGHGRTRYTYDCEHVFHVRCIREHFASMYSPDVLQSNSSSSNSITDRKWAGNAPPVSGAFGPRHYTVLTHAFFIVSIACPRSNRNLLRERGWYFFLL